MIDSEEIFETGSEVDEEGPNDVDMESDVDM